MPIAQDFHTDHCIKQALYPSDQEKKAQSLCYFFIILLCTFTGLEVCLNNALQTLKLEGE